MKSLEGVVKNLKISTGLLMVLGIFAVMQLLSGGLGLHFLKITNKDIQTLNYNAGEQKALNATRDAFFRARITIDTASLQKQYGEKLNVGQVIADVNENLAQAEKQYQEFVAIPGLSTHEPEIGRAMKQAYDQQVGVIRRNSQMIGDINDPAQFKQAVDAARAETLTARKAWDDEYRSYMTTTQSNLQAVVEGSNHSYNFATVIMLVMLAAVAALIVTIHFWLRRTMVRPLEEVAQHFSGIGKGDLTGKIQVKNRNEIGLLCEALQEMQAGLSQTVLSIRQGVDSINCGSREIAAGNRDLSSRTEEQAAAVVETAASVEQISSTVKLNTENAQQASQMIQNTTGIATEGETQMRNMVEKMGAIRTSAQKVCEIISVIDGIAFQTNILALNAAVEAARAGQSGRGFAVVAGEVRNLAQRCTNSAKEITTLINESTQFIEQGADLANQTGKTMSDICSAVAKINIMMENIALASAEQSSGVEQIRVAITQMDKMTQQNASLVEEVSATASSVDEQVNLLSGSVSVFRLDHQH